ncbi:hypothetical protein [Oscillibacter sp.]|uniref:hypothetical protein n=1 Tax=Oscillibacter sp. TaxID=1945593 RepID=UPI00339653B7
MKAVFLGAVSEETGPDLCCRFLANRAVKCMRVSSAGNFLLQNTLQIGRAYEVDVADGLVTAVRACEILPTPPASPSGAIPGLRTLKNLLATAMTPMGRALYVYGGGWNWQDTGAGPQAVCVGSAPEWPAFFRAQNGHYCYRDFYPTGGRNSYYCAGLDCSGYLGWTVYNTLHDKSGLSGYVCPAQGMARDYARRGWGRWMEKADCLRPGDVCSIAGHVWLCMGTCGDGSVLLAHSTPSESRAGCPGGGVQLSALSPADADGCAALALAESVMKRLCPAWYRRYAPVQKPYAVYTDFSGGVFRWLLDGSGVLSDPDGFAALSAEEILKRLLRGA